MNAVIPEQKDQAANRKKKGSASGRPVSHDADLYKERNTVKRPIATQTDGQTLLLEVNEATESIVSRPPPPPNEPSPQEHEQVVAWPSEC